MELGHRAGGGAGDDADGKRHEEHQRSASVPDDARAEWGDPRPQGDGAAADEAPQDPHQGERQDDELHELADGERAVVPGDREDADADGGNDRVAPRHGRRQVLAECPVHRAPDNSGRRDHQGCCEHEQLAEPRVLIIAGIGANAQQRHEQPFHRSEYRLRPPSGARPTPDLRVVTDVA